MLCPICRKFSIDRVSDLLPQMTICSTCAQKIQQCSHDDSAEALQAALQQVTAQQAAFDAAKQELAAFLAPQKSTTGNRIFTCIMGLFFGALGIGSLWMGNLFGFIIGAALFFSMVLVLIEEKQKYNERCGAVNIEILSAEKEVGEETLLSDYQNARTISTRLKLGKLFLYDGLSTAIYALSKVERVEAHWHGGPEPGDLTSDIRLVLQDGTVERTVEINTLEKKRTTLEMVANKIQDQIDKNKEVSE